MTSIQLVNDYKSKCLAIVEKYSNIDDISLTFDEDELLRDCCYITRAHFEDIIEERACSHLCGYVLCTNQQKLNSALKFKNNQIYHIKNNKVYDITRRKCFCTELCFKRADFLKNQISTEPLYLRKETLLPQNIKLYNDNLGQVGDEIQLKDVIEPEVFNIKQDHFDNKKSSRNDKISQNKLNENIVMKNQTKNNLLRNNKLIENKISAPYIKEETFNELKTKFKGLQIKEKNIIQNNTPGEEVIHFNVDNKVVQEKDKISDSIICEDRKNFRTTIQSENVGLSLESAQWLNQPKKLKFQKEKIIEDLLLKLSQWITTDTKSYLNVYQSEYDDKFENKDFIDLPEEESEQQKMERYKQQYNRLCARLDAEEIEDQKYDALVLSSKKKDGVSKCVDSPDDKPTKLTNQTKKSSKRENTRKTNSKRGKVSFKNDVEVKVIDDEKTSIEQDTLNKPIKDETDEPEPSLFFPVNEGTQSHIKRKQLFLKEIRLSIEEIFKDQLDIYEMDEIFVNIKQLINTFKLNAENTAFSNNQNLLIGIFLLKILIMFGMINDRYVLAYNENNFISSVIHKFYLTNQLLEDKLKQTIDNIICVKRK